MGRLDVIYGRSTLSKVIGVSKYIIRNIELVGKIHPKKRKIGEFIVTEFSKKDIGQIKKWVADHK